MSDIISTVLGFESACVELSVPKPSYIETTLEKEKENNIL